MQITGGYLNSRKIKTIKSLEARPTLSKTRQGIFNSLLSVIKDFSGKTFLDLFAGSAIMSFEAVSRGFEEVETVEKNKKTALLIKENINTLKIEPDLYVGDALKFLKSTDKKFDVIFIDPPYDSSLYDSSLEIIRTKKLLEAEGVIILEHKKNKLIDVNRFEIIKQKDYADTKVTFLRISEAL